MAGSILPQSRLGRWFAGSVATIVIATIGFKAGTLLNFQTLSQSQTVGNGAAAPRKPAPLKPNTQSAAISAAPTPAQLAEQFRVKRIMKIDKPLNHGVFFWDDAGVPAGPIVVTVDLKAQTMSVFRDGYEIGVAVILYGAGDKESPLGVFPILEKDANHFSNLYDNAPMPFAMRLTRDGVFVHGSDVIYGNATHGCIGIPTAFAKKLFAQAKIGDIVIITDGKRMNVG
jgi:hypothetical protein